MSRSVICIILVLLLSGTARAAFPVPHSANTASNGLTAEQNNAGANTTANQNFQSSENAQLPNPSWQGDGYGQRHWQRGEGMRAMFWGVWGLFFWPFGILAIVHGIRGLGSHNGREQDRALLGLILGIGEVIACIFAVVLFFALFWF